MKSQEFSLMKASILPISFILTIILLSGGLNYSFAQDFEDEDMRTAVVQYTLKYRFRPDRKSGDMVKYELDPLDKANLGEKMGMINMMMDKQGARQQIKSWKKSDRQETTDCPAGSFDCDLLVPVYSDLYNSQVEEDRSAMKQSGKSGDEIAAGITRNEPKLLFSGKVPRMIPIAMAMGWMPNIEAFGEVEGGLVVSRPMFSVRLVEYSK
jgi:hypothetical protein